MLKRQTLPILLICGTVLASAGFFAGVELEGFRFFRTESTHAATNLPGSTSMSGPFRMLRPRAGFAASLSTRPL